MKLTENQKMALFVVALDSLRCECSIFGIRIDERKKLCDQIVNQQDENKQKSNDGMA